jgi:predicted amidohydrolase
MRIVLFESSDRENGRTTYSEILESVEKQAVKGDFWILPEAFDTGWNVTEDTKFPSMENLIFFHQLSEKYGISICGSFYVEKDGYFYNRFAVVTKDGEEFFYGKAPPFRRFRKKTLQGRL